MSKASKLFILKQNGFNIPEFIFTKDQNYRLTFKADRYIIRSSFSAEDSDKSFAGIFRSYGPVKEQEIKHYLKKVINGTHSAAIYGKKSGLKNKLKPGAIIQRYIPAKIGGVCFTDYNSTIIVESGKNAAKVTSGEKVDSTYKISRFSLDTKRIPPNITELIADALDIEAIFKKPQDIEWLKNDKLYILQTRDAKQVGRRQFENVSEFLSTIPPSKWDRYLAFAFKHSEEFRKTAYLLAQKLLRLEVFDWETVMQKSYRKPTGKMPVERFKNAVVNYGYYGVLNQITEDNSLAMKRVLLSANRLGLNNDILLDYAINRKTSVYSKIISNPDKYNETFVEEIKTYNIKKRKRKSINYNFSTREKKVADFFALLYDIKCYGVVYHDYCISPIINAAYEKIPEKLKKNNLDYTEILAQNGFTVPKLNKSYDTSRPIYALPFTISGEVGTDILIYKDVTPEAVLKLKNIKCIMAEEGGILSHAAIIAKEFDISFIAGIKGATRLFNNGDKLIIKSNGLQISINNKTKKKDLRIKADLAK